MAFVGTVGRSMARGRMAARSASTRATVGELDHIAIACKDVDSMLKFYNGLLGFPAMNVDKFRQGQASFPSVRINQGTILDFFPLEDANASFQQVSHFCVRLNHEDYENIKNVMAANGINPTRGEGQMSGARGTGTGLYYKDPEQNSVELRYYQDYTNPDYLRAE
ncbi:hypothetical protein NDN08_006498 [Rhodosorus marinus]|uniref:VOC domain-containing protein n=1 Tax=Rhodosorus marinus TaxID=101924 RepID=A0AAV8UHT6_9RHOD|nr:hypothetical protein NDN08_006498 [Rhodosorus marinus]